MSERVVRSYLSVCSRVSTGRDRLLCERGDISPWSIFGMLVLITSYLLYPDLYHNFFRFLINSFQDVLSESFGGEGKEGSNGGTNDGAKDGVKDGGPGGEKSGRNTPSPGRQER